MPTDLLNGSLADLGISDPARRRPARRRRTVSLSDVWSALGGELKPSLDLTVIAPLLPERFAEAGPPVTDEPVLTMVDRRTDSGETHGGRPMPTDRAPGACAPPPPAAAADGTGRDAARRTVLSADAVRRATPRSPTCSAGSTSCACRVAAVVAARRAVDASPDDPFLGLYLSDDKIDDLLRNDRVWVADDVAADRRAAVEAAADAAAAAGAVLRLRALADRFDLDDLDVEMLLAAMAPDVDDRFERYYGYLNDDVTRRRVSVGLALGLAGVAAPSALGRRASTRVRRCVGGGLVEIEDPDRPFLTRPLRVPDRVTAHVLGADEPDAALAFVLVDVAPTAEPPFEPLVRALAEPTRSSTSTTGSRRRSHAASSTPPPPPASRRVVIDLDRVSPPTPTPSARRRRGPRGPAARRRARRRPDRRARRRRPGAVQRLTASPGAARAHRPPRVGPGVGAPGRRSSSRRPRCRLRRGPRIWATALDGARGDGFDPPGRRRTTGSAPGRSAGRPRPRPSRRGLDDRAVGERRRAARCPPAERRPARAARPAHRAGVSWDDLVLPPPVRAGLRDLAERARHRERVLGEWRMRPGGGRGTGITALFAGDSGTGKTMSAEVIATDLGLDLYVVNLATVVDKYIGETEKNLDRIFAEADDVNGVLLFDEADALFGQRSEVRDSHDRYANIEVAYLLQRMETFDGLAILATNLRSNIDDAFTRRLDVVVDFPMPDARAAPAACGSSASSPLPLRRRPRPRLLRRGVRAVRRQHPLDRRDDRLPSGGRRPAVDMADVIRAVGRGVPQARPAVPRGRVRPVLPAACARTRRGARPVRAARAARRSDATRPLPPARRRPDTDPHPRPDREEPMPTYLSPGVYVEEVAPAPSRSKASAPPSPRSSAWPRRARPNQPTLITNWRQYVEKFGDITAGAYLGHAVYGYLLNGGGNCYVVRIGSDNGDADNVDQSSARARIGDLEVRAVEAGPGRQRHDDRGDATARGLARGTVRIVVTRGDVREEHEALPLSGRGNVVNTLNRSRLVRVELDPAVSQLEELPRGIDRRSPAASSSTST